MLPPHMLVHMLVALGSQVRPEPAGRWGRNAAKHIAVSDVFFPTGAGWAEWGERKGFGGGRGRVV